MLRSAIATVLASASVLAAVVSSAEPPPRPPSSLEPEQARGTVSFYHHHQRVVACAEERKNGKLVCKPKLESLDRGTALTVQPVGDRSNLAERDRRSAVAVRFEDEPSPQKVELELAVGVWELVWDGLQKRPRLRVGEDDEFAVKLSTVAGACNQVRSRCVVAPLAQQRSVSVPERCRAQ
jgi:hypothetical protein